MKGRLLLLALLMLGWAPARAEHPAECRVAENLLESSFRLPQVTQRAGAEAAHRAGGRRRLFAIARSERRGQRLSGASCSTRLLSNFPALT